MHIRDDGKAVSTLILIILIVVSLVIGGLISYMWVLGNFYLQPENTTELVITEANFPLQHADYFNFTVMNPSNSISATNITRIYLTVEGDATVYNVTDTYPETLPILVPQATSKTIKCLTNWSQFAGKAISIHLIASKASGAVKTVQTEFVKLELETFFDAALSIKQFSLSVRNSGLSRANLTINKVLVNHQTVENVTMLPSQNLTIGGSVTVRGNFSWENLANPIVRVETAEGYYVEKTVSVNASVLLVITDVTFNESNTNDFSVTVQNSPLSKTLVDINDITVTDVNGTKYHINGNLTNPQFNPTYRLGINQTVTFQNCTWNWTNYRDKDVTITVYTKQEFTPVSKTAKTPPSVILKVTVLDFDLTNTGNFSATITSASSSLQDVSITSITFVNGTSVIKINQTSPAFNSTLITIGGTQTFNCTLDWAVYRGKNVTVNFYTAQKFNASLSTILPVVALTVTFDENLSPQYFNLTIQNKAFVTLNATGVRVLVGNLTYTMNLTFPSMPRTIDANATLVILCQADWQLWSGQQATIIVDNVNGIDINTEVTVP